MRVLLQHVAHARSGDKGNTSNICVIAYTRELYPHLKQQLTAERGETRFHTVLYGHRPVCQADFDVMPQRGTGCSLISGLVMQA